MESKIVNGKEYQIVKLLGKGKGGYSYLARCDGKDFVLKQIHHEPCSYYTFGNKIEAENNDYHRLLNTGITIPKMIDIDFNQEIIIKEYIDGDTIYDLVLHDIDISKYINKAYDIEKHLKEFSINVDYFPTNFIPKEDKLYYIDYECNNYMEEWNFTNWGIKYWSKTQEFLDYVKSHENK